MKKTLDQELKSPQLDDQPSKKSFSTGTPQPEVIGLRNQVNQTVKNFQLYRDIVQAVPAAAQEKMGEMLIGYTEAAESARDLDPLITVPPNSVFLEHIHSLPLKMLLKIANFGKPTILVVPNNSFQEKIDNMNKFKPYSDPSTKAKQQNINLDLGWDSPYELHERLAKNTISITDGQAHMPDIDGIDPDTSWWDLRDAFQAYFKQKGLRLINVPEGAALMHQSMRNYANNGQDISKIVDYISPENATMSCFSRSHLLNSSGEVAYFCFSSGNRQISFNSDGPSHRSALLKGRPVLELFSY